jgi:hypothetical protein
MAPLAAEAPRPPAFAFVHASDFSDAASLAHRTHFRPMRHLPEVDLLLSSRVPTSLRCPLPVRCATNLVNDVEVGSRCLLNFFRRRINTTSYTSTSRNHLKIHKYHHVALYLRRKVASGSRRFSSTNSSRTDFLRRRGLACIILNVAEFKGVPAGIAFWRRTVRCLRRCTNAPAALRVFNAA